MSAIETFRDAIFGNPPSPTTEPSREGTLAAFTELYNQSVVALYAAQAGVTTVATIADRNAFYAIPANRTKLVYVNNNNGSATDPANGVYEYASGAPRLSQAFYAGVATIVQPLVDEADGSQKRASNAVPFETKAGLDAATGMVEGDRASVLTGPDKGMYQYQSGTWVRTGDLDSQAAEGFAGDAQTAASEADISAQSVLSARLGAGDLSREARAVAAPGANATFVTRSKSDETPTGLTMTSAQSGASASIQMHQPLPGWFVDKYRGCVLHLIGGVRIDTGYMADKGFVVPTVAPVGPIFVAYNDGTASANIGTVVSNALDPADPLLFVREASVTLAPNFASVGMTFQISGGAVANNAHTIRYEAFTIRCMQVPVGAKYTASDVNAALTRWLGSRGYIGEFYEAATWAVTAANGAVARTVNGKQAGLTIPSGSTGADSQIVATLALDAAWRGKFAGQTLRGELVIATSATMTRDVVQRLFQNSSQIAGGSINAEVLQVTPTRRLYSIKGFTLMPDSATSIALSARLPGGTSNTAPTASDEFIEIIGASVSVADPGTVAEMPADASARIADARLRASTANAEASAAAAAANRLTARGELMTQDAALAPQLLNGAVAIYDGNGRATGFTLNGVSGANSFIDRYFVPTAAEQADWNGRQVKITAKFAITPGFMAARGLGLTNISYIRRGSPPDLRNEGVRTDTVSADGLTLTRELVINFDSAITRLGYCSQIAAAATTAGNHSIELKSWVVELLPAATQKATTVGDDALKGRIAGFITEAPSDGNIHGRRNGAWAVVPSGGGGGERPSIGQIILTQSNGEGSVPDSFRLSHPRAWQSERIPGYTMPLPGIRNPVGRGGYWPPVADAMYDRGYRLVSYNAAIGGMSLERDVAGIVRGWQAAATGTRYSQQRAAEPDGDMGDFGHLVEISGKVFVCELGAKRYAMKSGPSRGGAPNAQQDYIGFVNTGAGGAQRVQGSTAPDVSAINTVGQTVNDGDVGADTHIRWRYLGPVGGLYGGANTVLNRLNHKGAGHDPLGILWRAIRDGGEAIAGCHYRDMIIGNAQGSAGVSSDVYRDAIVSVAGMAIEFGFRVISILEMFQPSSGTTAYNQLQQGRADAIAALTATYGAGRIIDGPNQYADMGTGGPMRASRFTGSITGNTLTVTSTNWGTIGIGDKIINRANNAILGTVTAVPSAGVYTLSDAVAIASSDLKSGGIWWQHDDLNVGIHIGGEGAVGANVGAQKTAANSVIDSFAGIYPALGG